MFDPTIFENLKVGIENAVYDLDNLDEIIRVTDRKDLWIWPRYPEASTSGSSWRVIHNFSRNLPGDRTPGFGR